MSDLASLSFPCTFSWHSSPDNRRQWNEVQRAQTVDEHVFAQKPKEELGEVAVACTEVDVEANTAKRAPKSTILHANTLTQMYNIIYGTNRIR